jgi:ACS family hexuronate transporter-like MFS transporter
VSKLLDSAPSLRGDTQSKLRWAICALLFLATVINYIDRQVFSILAPSLQHDIGWSELGYARIVIAFQLSYAITLAVSGNIIDRIGARLGYALTFVWWSIAEIAHALAHSPLGFGIVRLFVGAGEGAIFPAAIRTISEWFPRRESGLAIGILNCGPTVGAIAGPILVPLAAARFGWRGTFVITGALGVVWIAAWLVLYRGSHAGRRERGLIVADPLRDSGVSWLRLLGCRQMWAYGAGKLLADPAWFFYLFWLPKFLSQDHGLRGTALIPYLTTVYVLTGVGSICGGFLSSSLIRHGWSVNRSRKATMAASALAMPIVIVAARTQDPWTCVLLIGVAMAAHQSWSSMVFTLGTDLFPTKATAAATGIAGAMGSFATILFAETAGRVLEHDPSAYFPMFVACGLMYLVALGIIQLLAPRMEPAALG